MTKRDVVREVMLGRKPAYVPWNYQFTVEAWARLVGHFGSADAAELEVDNHFLELGAVTGYFDELGGDRVRDVFGVIWNRSVDKDIGVVEGHVLPHPTLEGYRFPDPRDPRYCADIPSRIDRYPDRFRVFCLGFSLFERAWTLRGMENLMMDFYDAPEFVHALLAAIADYDISQIKEALKFDIDAVLFGDDWGQQHGLIMGARHWREFILPQLRRMYGTVRDAGKFQMIHSCGDVDELFDDLIEAGVNCFNPFQPEVMDVTMLMTRYRGRLVFHGGLSTQRTLPNGSVDEVRSESRRLLELGRNGGYIFSPAHAVEGDVPLENMLCFVSEARAQRDRHG